METLKVVLGILLGLALAALVLLALVRLSRRKSAGITEKDLRRWFQRRRP
jgi:hypothetical protein